jgi:hypothetical protein
VLVVLLLKGEDGADVNAAFNKPISLEHIACPTCRYCCGSEVHILSEYCADVKIPHAIQLESVLDRGRMLTIGACLFKGRPWCWEGLELSQ